MKANLNIEKVKKYVKKALASYDASHGWFHTERVWQMAKYIAKKEQANIFIIELSALLHDVSDWKYQDVENVSLLEDVKIFLKTLDIKQHEVDSIIDIISSISFKGNKVADNVLTLEGQIVQDADRLDAIGAIGITRAFTFGGAHHREIYNPEISPQSHKDFYEYKKSKGTTINHFYEKLLLLKDRMHTRTAKHIAKKRHEFMKTFLKKFFLETKEKEFS